MLSEAQVSFFICFFFLFYFVYLLIFFLRAKFSLHLIDTDTGKSSYILVSPLWSLARSSCRLCPWWVENAQGCAWTAWNSPRHPFCKTRSLVFPRSVFSLTSTLSQRKDRAPQPWCVCGGGSVVWVGLWFGGGPPQHRRRRRDSIRPIRLTVAFGLKIRSCWSEWRKKLFFFTTYYWSYACETHWCNTTACRNTFEGERREMPFSWPMTGQQTLLCCPRLVSLLCFFVFVVVTYPSMKKACTILSPSGFIASSGILRKSSRLEQITESCQACQSVSRRGATRMNQRTGVVPESTLVCFSRFQSWVIPLKVSSTQNDSATQWVFLDGKDTYLK